MIVFEPSVGQLGGCGQIICSAAETMVATMQLGIEKLSNQPPEAQHGHESPRYEPIMRHRELGHKQYYVDAP